MTAGTSVDTTDLGPLAIQIGKWAEQQLEPYLNRFPANPNIEPKQIHDSIGKVVLVHPWEVYVLDSPLMQRLRYVRQLGVGHLLFPTGGYTRFEHSLGAMQLASQMFDSIVETHHSTTSPEQRIYTDGAFAKRHVVVRLAALLHDLGHCIFSHVSEKSYTKRDDVQELVGSLRKHFRPTVPASDGSPENQLGPMVTASESVSIAILISPVFKDLLRRARVDQWAYDEDALTNTIVACIAGAKDHLAPDCFMAELVNGPVDCDKLDYLSRDAHSVGVPVALDTSRLLSKLRLVRRRTQSNAELYSLAVVPSGARALDELLVSRLFLYDKFYYHPKVMAAEELLRRALHYLEKCIPDLSSPANLLRFGDDEFISLTPTDLAARYGVAATNTDLVWGCELLRRLRMRDLPKRAFALANRFLPEMNRLLARFQSLDSKTVVQGQYEYMDAIYALEDPEIRENETAVISTYAKELGAEGEVFVAVQSRRAAGGMHIPAVLPEGSVEDKTKLLFDASQWTEAYALNKQTSFVFAYERRDLVHLAAERLFLEGWSVDFAPHCWDFAKVGRNALANARKGLPQEWDRYLVPPNFIRLPEQQERIRLLQQRFASYLNALHPKLGSELVPAWIDQFPDPCLKASALGLLEHITYVEPMQVRQAFAGVLGDQRIAKALWVPLRAIAGGGESADLLNYELKDLNIRVKQMAAVTATDVEESSSVLFFDDALNSGVQSACRLASWLGSPSLCESRKDMDDSVAPAVAAALKSAPIFFAFYAAHPTGKKRLTRTCEQVGLKAPQILSTVDSSEVRYNLEGYQGRSPAARKRFVEYLQRRGEVLLGAKLGRSAYWTEDRIKGFALGYSGISLTIAFRHGVSASTPVALWYSVADKSADDYWLPLFPRRERDALLRRIDPEHHSGAAKLPEYRGS